MPDIPLSPRGGRTIGAGGFDLPADLLQKARARVGTPSLIVAVLAPAFAIVSYLTTKQITLQLAVDGFVSLISVALRAAVATKRLTHTTVLNLTLGYEFVLCLAISVGTPWVMYERTGALQDISWVCVLIVFFPLIVPSPPLRTLSVSVASATAVPLGPFVLGQAGIIPPGEIDYVALSIAPAFCVAMAYMASRSMYGISADVARARQIGSYRLQSLLGRGGMGEVWRAWHGLLAMPAAVKLIRPQALGTDEQGKERILKRFKREARATAILKSPHTVHLLDFGVTSDSVFYYVMELLEGLDLETLVMRFGPIPPERAVHILIQVCDSLDEAHANGLIHRDIKPANLFVCRHGRETDLVKVVDFGLVKETSTNVPTQTDITAENVIVGTPEYLSPETALRGDAADARSDIYSLGCVAYWLLTGKPVFEAESPMQVIVEHVKTDPIRLSRRIDSDIPEHLEGIIMKCLQKNPDLRPQSARELALLLQRECAMQTEWTQERADLWWSEHMPQHQPLENDSPTDRSEAGA